MTSLDAARLRIIATWFDRFDTLFVNTVTLSFPVDQTDQGLVQDDLRRIADEIDAKCTTPG